VVICPFIGARQYVGVARTSSVPTSPPPAPTSSFSALAPHGPDDVDDMSCGCNNGQAEVSHLHGHVCATVHWWHDLEMSIVKSRKQEAGH
jgi:hypothetical protein